ncbi:hypothetical protein AAIH32_12805 [Pseudarthrobacter oxydans]|uniref:hypothetical protein n=1 Tax=Pseudarthrobacter oxydans TaxID=1671 RepID=UPI003D2BF7DB
MLAQILPGFRDFKTPLITGYLWLVVVWIGFSMPIPSKDVTTGAMGMINWLTGYTSTATILAVLSFVAYVIGILVTIDVKLATRLIAKYGFRMERQITDKGKYRWTRLRHRDNVSHRTSLDQEAGSTLLKLLWAELHKVETRNVLWSAVYDEYQLPIPSEEEQQALKEEVRGDEKEYYRRLRKAALRKLSPILMTELEIEIPVLATKLQEKNKDLFDSYDRDRSEAEFRLSIALPIAVLAVQLFFLGLSGDLVLGTLTAAFGLIASVVLLRKGWLKVLDSTSVVVTALEIGTVTSHVFERLDELKGRRAPTKIPPPILG